MLTRDIALFLFLCRLCNSIIASSSTLDKNRHRLACAPQSHTHATLLRTTCIKITHNNHNKPPAQKAKEAYKTGDVQASMAAHAAPGGASVEHHGGLGSEYVKSIVFGGLGRLCLRCERFEALLLQT
jgi:hypothetical protein